MPSLEWNLRLWDKDYPWVNNGEEWSDMAVYCGVPYEMWKDRLARTFIVPNIRQESTVLEIGPGHGRWSALIPHRALKGTVHLVDLSSSCIEYCKKRFSQYTNIQYHVTDGVSLRPISDRSVDFCFSIDVFVHVEEPETRSYIKEFARVLRPTGMGVIHHPGNPTPEQRAAGCRSLVTSAKWKNLLTEAGLHVIRQADSWDGGNVKLQNDMLSIFVKP